jgi:hypothetical protein
MSGNQQEEARQIDLWIGARLGLRSGAYGGLVAGILLGLAAASLVLFTDLTFSRLVLFNIFWLAGIYGFVLGLVAGALGGLIAGAIMGATRVPPRLTAAGAGAGALSGFALIVLFFALYSWLNTGTIAVAALVDLIPVALLAALTGAVAGAIGGRRFAHYYALRPTASAAEHEERWERR